MRISDLLSEEQIVIGFSPTDKNSTISQLVDVIATSSKVDDLEAIREAVFEREELMSTGVGKGLALPHAKTTGVLDTVAALAVLSTPVDFDAIDEEPVSIVFLLVGPPDSKSQHVRILSRISRLMNRQEIRERIIASTSPTELLTLLVQFEKQLISD